jgi:bacterioferritin-associated ferredoxin
MIIIPMYICICNAITERDVRECARRGCGSLDQLSVELGVGTGCGRCRLAAKEILDETRPEPLALAA